MNKYANMLLGFISQIHIYHWQTMKYSDHMALGGLYDGIHDLADEFMEVYMGKYGRADAGVSSAYMIDYDIANTLSKISEFEQFLVECDLPDTDLLNIRDEMLALVHKTQYLLTLS
jgi:hypothetical protein